VCGPHPHVVRVFLLAFPLFNLSLTVLVLYTSSALKYSEFWSFSDKVRESAIDVCTPHLTFYSNIESDYIPHDQRVNSQSPYTKHDKYMNYFSYLK
jgi:hypothetical protein